MGRDKVLYLLSVLLALSIFAPTAVILPSLEDKTSFTYQVLFFLFTLGAVVLLFFAISLIRDGIKGIYRSLSLLGKILQSRHKS